MRVLVAEQEASMVRILQAFLKEQGFRVEVASEYEEAERKARSVRYDLIVLSLALGGHEGMALLRAWRQAGVSSPILALTSADSMDERVLCLNLGADHYLCRPLRMEEFQAHVAALLRRAYGVSSSLLCVRDLEIDTSTQTVKRGGRPVHLTRREYTLLQFLAFNRGKVVSRSVIKEHMYGEQNGHTTNVVDAFIRSLRRKIDRGFDVPLILTRYGKGYQLRDEE